MFVESVIFLIVVTIWWILNDTKKYKGVPPGPVRFPIIGNLPQLITKSSDPAVAFDQLSKTYGDIMFVNIGKLDAVIFSSHNTITEIYNNDNAINRAASKIPVVYERMLSRNLGVLWSNDDVWLALRRFTLRTLRDFGFGKTLSMDFVINEELDKFTAHLDKLIQTSNPKGVLHFDGFFDLTIINVLWRLVTGINYSLEDSRINHLLRISNDMMKSSSFSFDLSIGFPYLRDWFPSYFGRDEGVKIVNELHKFAQDTIGEHRASGNYKTDPKGFVDIFLEKIDESKENGHPHFNDDQLVLTILDLFQAGAETTSKTLSFGILYMILNPQIQEKVRKEIASVVPANEPMTMSHKSKLPYTSATLLEVLRYSVVVPFPPTREASADFYFEGHFIKKGTALMPNVYAAHFKKSVWGDPHSFRPERFLTSDGSQLDPKMESFVLPFGGGKRICAGKNLAEANLFLYFTSLLRAYKFEKVPNTPEPSTIPMPGMTYSPQPFNAQITKRTIIT